MFGVARHGNCAVLIFRILKYPIMKRLLILSLIALTAASCGNCRQKRAERKAAAAAEQSMITPDHNARNSLDWAGTYEATLPCADCPGILLKITLNEDGTFAKTVAYLERPNIFATQGTFTWDETGNVVTLDDNGSLEMLRVGENTLTILDLEGNAITGESAEYYILTKS